MYWLECRSTKNCNYLREDDNFLKPSDFKWSFLVVLCGVVVLMIGIIRNGSTFFESNYIHIVNDFTSYIVWGWIVIGAGCIFGVIILIKGTFDKKQRKEIRQDSEKLKNVIKNGAKKGNPDAIFELGILHYYGYYFQKNNEEALRLFKKAYSLGVGQAAYYLALMYEKGLGFETNFDKAFSLLNESIKMASCENETITVAYSKIGQYYKEGKGGVPIDEKKAFDFFLKSIECKKFIASDGYYQLGLCYLNGIGCKIDAEKSKMYLKKASDLGHANANELMLSMYDGKY